MTTIDQLIRDNVAFLRQGAALLRAMSDEDFLRVRPPLYASNVGAHVRHVLDHYRQFLDGVVARAVDYDQRQRDATLETDRRCAIATLEALCRELRALADPAAKHPGEAVLDVRMKTGVTAHTATPPHTHVANIDAPGIGAGDGGGAVARSTIARELQFLVSHTVHHWALIAFMLRSEGLAVPEGFGISPSTLEYRHGLRRHAAC